MNCEHRDGIRYTLGYILCNLLDCTHIAIKAPSTNEEAYVNRKGVHSINVQAVCDVDMKLLDLVAKWLGSSHDRFIWRG